MNSTVNSIDVSIIIINYKVPQLISNAINSVVKMTKNVSYEILIVDNSNSENDYSLLCEMMKGEFTILNPNANLGFGKANNFAAKKARGKALLFLNPDTLLLNNAVFELYSFLFSSLEIGAVGANLFTANSKPNNSYFLKEKNLSTESSSYFWSNIFRKLSKNFYFNHSQKPLLVNGYLCGACLMVKKDVFNYIGGFDSDIFMYAEDSLICYEIINKANRKIYNVPSAQVIHFEGGSFTSINSVKANYIVEGNYIYYLKAFGKAVAIKYLKNCISKLKKKKVFIICFRKNKTSSLSVINELLKAYQTKLNVEASQKG